MTAPDRIPDEYLAAARRLLDEDSMGLCVACGAEACQVEPDAREYECERCGADAVYGAEEVVLTWGDFS